MKRPKGNINASPKKRIEHGAWGIAEEKETIGYFGRLWIADPRPKQINYDGTTHGKTERQIILGGSFWAGNSFWGKKSWNNGTAE